MTPQACHPEASPLPVVTMGASENNGNLKQLHVTVAPTGERPTTKPADMSIADFYRCHGYKTLVHRCVIWQNAVSILKTGNLAPFGSYKDQLPGFGGCADENFVYFRASTREQTSDSKSDHSIFTGDCEQITFVHDLSVLDNYPMYTGSRYGNPTPETFSTVSSLPLRRPLTAKVTYREILVQHKISNRSLTAIWVYPSRREEFLARFMQAGIDTVDGLPLADFINPDKPLPGRLTANDRSPLLDQKF